LSELFFKVMTLKAADPVAATLPHVVSLSA
jgi:hypothetical protein